MPRPEPSKLTTVGPEKYLIAEAQDRDIKNSFYEYIQGTKRRH